MSRIFEVREVSGLVVGLRARPVRGDIAQEDGWRTVTEKVYEQLAQRKTGKMARLNGSSVVWEDASTRPIETAKAALTERLERLTDEALLKKYRLITLLRYLTGHSIAIGVMADPQSTQVQKAAALDKERNIRGVLTTALDKLDGLQDKLSALRDTIAEADNATALNAVNIKQIGEDA